MLERTITLNHEKAEHVWLVEEWFISSSCLFTSGTTGLLKGVEQNFGHTSKLASVLIYQWRPFEHISSSPSSLAELAGAKLAQVNGFC